MALLLTQTTPGAVDALRLRAARAPLRSYEPMLDAIDMLNVGLAPDARRVDIEWTPAADTETTIVPLGILHSFRFRSVPTDLRWVQVADHVALAPQRLVLVSEGREITLPLEPALSPMLLGDTPGG